VSESYPDGPPRNTYANPFAYTYTYANPFAYTYTYTYTYAYAYAYAYAYTYAYAYIYIYTNPDPNLPAQLVGRWQLAVPGHPRGGQLLPSQRALLRHGRAQL
jgi:hypothetical protein